MHERGDHIDIWVVDEQLGSGGMGSVYRCHNRAAPRILAAIKVLESSLRRNEEAEARFVREAEILYSLDHPHIVKVRNVRTECDPPYLEMEFVAGQSLEDWLGEGPLDYGLAVRLMHQMAEAVRYLHSRGICHRDIKPPNVLVQDDGAVKLVDFGLAVETDRTRITEHGITFGTVSYAPPEWITPDALDAERWDHYALGVVFYEMLTGRLAFPVSGQGSARQQAMQVIVSKQGHRPLDPGPTFPDAIRRLVGDLTRAEPTERLDDLDEVVGRLGRIVAQAPEPSGRIREGSILEPPDHLVPTTVASAPTWRSDEPAIPVESDAAGWWVAGLGAAMGMLLLGFGGLAAWWILSAIGAPSRDVVVVTRTDAEIVLDGRVGAQDGEGWRFSGVPTEADVPLVWVVGEDCRIATCPGDACPVWCAAGEQIVRVPQGAGAHRLDLPLPPVPSRTLTVEFPHYGPLARLAVEIDGVRGERRRRSVTFADLSPGRYRLVARGGRCDDAPTSCWPDGECAERCVAHEREIVVPWEGEDPVVTIEMPVPEQRLDLPGFLSPEPEPEPEPEPRPAAEPAPAPRATNPHGLVTTAAFASWLEDHPDWQAEGRKGSAQGEGYLYGWSGARPPADRAPTEPLIDVTYPAAKAYCASRGGLAAPDAPPLEWTESEVALAFEWRESGLNPGIRESTGGFLPGDGQPRAMMANTGVRCAR